jgi:hypothetical protein
VRSIIKNCSETNQNEVIKEACKIIHEEIDPEIKAQKEEQKKQTLEELETLFQIKA